MNHGTMVVYDMFIHVVCESTLVNDSVEIGPLVTLPDLKR